ncbi:MAG: RNA ligase family protein [Clostridia bacterium]|nr:RNA ligase family protein [Clostridia bacterium]
MEDFKILKYPRTPHLQGSNLQEGDEDLSRIPFSEIFNKNIVIEEKVDGANSAISFNEEGKLLLQSRGRYLTGGFKERHYNLLKTWANQNITALYNALGSRYIMYGEWMYAKHAVFYDALPAYFLEFDIYDRQNQVFLDTQNRRKITCGLGVYSVPVLAQGVFKNKEQILKLITNSNYITKNNKGNLIATVNGLGLNEEEILSQTNLDGIMEGLYIKVEEDGVVKNRVKFVRSAFKQSLKESDKGWHQRPIIPNLLAKKD